MFEHGPGASGKRVIVLGAGVAGLAAADKLSREGHSVMVIERACQAGGTHRSREIGPYTFDVGSIFYEETASLLGLAPDLRVLCPTVKRIQRRIAPDGSVLHYPLEPQEFLRQPLPAMIRAGASLAWSRLTVRRDGTLDAISRKRLGSVLFRSTGLQAYMSRFHHIPPKEIDEEFFFHRMAFVERFTRANMLLRSVLRAVVARRSVNAKTRRPLYVRPREGYQAIFEPIVARLKAQGVSLSFGEELVSLKREGGLFCVATPAGRSLAEVVVSTIPLDTLHNVMFNSASGLVSLDMTTLFVSAGHLAPSVGNVLFNFHHRGRWKRATIYSRIYPQPATTREFFAVETTIPPFAVVDPQGIFTDFKAHLMELGLAEDLVLEGYEHVEHCYPLYTPGSRNLLAKAAARIADQGIILAGRQGRFEYLPTSTGVIRRVAEELDAANLSSVTSNVAA